MPAPTTSINSGLLLEVQNEVNKELRDKAKLALKKKVLELQSARASKRRSSAS